MERLVRLVHLLSFRLPELVRNDSRGAYVDIRRVRNAACNAISRALYRASRYIAVGSLPDTNASINIRPGTKRNARLPVTGASGTPNAPDAPHATRHALHTPNALHTLNAPRTPNTPHTLRTTPRAFPTQPSAQPAFARVSLNSTLNREPARRAPVRVYHGPSQLILVGTIGAICQMVDHYIDEESAGRQIAAAAR